MATGGPAATLSYLGYRTGSAIALALPERLARSAAGVAGRVLGASMRRRRTMLERHLRRVYGAGVTDEQLQRSVGEAFESYARYWLEAFRLQKETPESLGARLEVQGIEHVDAALAAGRGVIVATAHLGNWDLGGAWFAAHGYRPATVAEPLHPPELFEWFCKLRRDLGVEVVALDRGAGSAMLQALRDNRVIGLVCDRDLHRAGVPVEFFGEPTTLPAGPATLALRSGAPIFAAAVFFRESGRHLCLIRPPVPTARHGSVREDVARITQAVTYELEELIRRAPEQWHLLQPNWPSDYAEGGATPGSSEQREPAA